MIIRRLSISFNEGKGNLYKKNFIHSPLENPALKGGDEGGSVSTYNRPRSLDRGSRRLIYWIIVLVVLMSSYGFCLANNKVADNNSPEYFKELGDEYKEQHKNIEALESYKRALELNPKMVSAHIGAGRIYGRLKKYDEAINEFEVAINLSPDSVESVTCLIWLYLYKDNRAKAIDLYKRLEIIAPKEADEILPMLLQSKYQKLEADEERLSLKLGTLKYEPTKQIKPYLDEALKLEREGKIDEAIEVYTKSLAIEETPTAYFYLSDLHLRKRGDINTAAIFLEKALGLEPDNVGLIYTLSVLYVVLGEEEKALQRINTLITKEPKNLLYLYIKGYIYFYNRKWQEAIRVWDKLKKYDSESFRIIERYYKDAENKVSMSIYSFYEELDSFLKNRTPTQEEKQPKDVVLISSNSGNGKKDNLIILPLYTAQTFELHLFNKRKFEELIEFCELVLAARKDTFTYSRLARAFEILGKIDKAIEVYSQEIETAPDEPMPYFNLWGIYAYDKNDRVKAEENLNKFNQYLSISKGEYLSKVKTSLVEDLMRTGNYFLNELQQPDNAIKYFEMTLKLNPNHERGKFNLLVCKINMTAKIGDKDNFEKVVNELRAIAQTSKDKDVISVFKQLSGVIEEKRKEADRDYFDNKAIEYSLEGKFKEAKECFQKSLEMNKLAFPSRNSIELLNDFEKGILNKEYTGYFFRGLAYHRNKEYQEAIKQFQKAIEVNSKYPKAYFYVGLEYLSLTLDEKAVPYFEKVIQLAPDSVEAYWGLGSIYEKIGKYKLARDNLERAKALFQQEGNYEAVSSIDKRLNKFP